MLLSRAFALSCDKRGHGKDRRTAHRQRARRSRRGGFALLARRGAVIQQDRGDPRRSERPRSAARAAERQADRRSDPGAGPSVDPTGLAVLPADDFRGLSRSLHGQPWGSQRPPRRIRHRRASRRPHAARCALAQGRILAGRRDRRRASPRRCAARTRSSGSRRSIGTSTSASASSTIRSSTAAPTSGPPPATRSPRPRRLRGLCDRQAADAAPRRNCRPRPLSGDRQGSGAPRRPCGARRPRGGPHVRARQRHRPAPR